MASLDFAVHHIAAAMLPAGQEGGAAIAPVIRSRQPPAPTRHHRSKREAARTMRKADELAPYIEAAMARKTTMAPLAEDQIPSFVALGRQVAADQLTPEQAERRRRIIEAAQIPLEAPPTTRHSPAMSGHSFDIGDAATASFGNGSAVQALIKPFSSKCIQEVQPAAERNENNMLIFYGPPLKRPFSSWQERQYANRAFAMASNGRWQSLATRMRHRCRRIEVGRRASR